MGWRGRARRRYMDSIAFNERYASTCRDIHRTTGDVLWLRRAERCDLRIADYQRRISGLSNSI